MDEMGDLATTSSRGDAPPTVGILFVHGIGEQQRGDTLLRFAEPLLDWLDEWARPAELDRSGLEFEETALREEGTGEPAHTSVMLPVSGGTCGKARLVLAESWWAAAFQGPSFASMLLWVPVFSFRVVKRLLQHANRLRPRVTRRLRTLRLKSATTESDLWQATTFALAFIMLAIVGIAWAALFLLLIPLSAIAMLILAIARFVPVLRNFVAKAQLAIANSTGDTYVLLHSPLRFDAMVTRVRADYEWLAKRVDQVVLVGHSQGAVVAHKATELHQLERLNAFVTVGSALNLIRDGGGRWDPETALQLFRSRYPCSTWTDFWAEFDPVSAGPLVDHDADGFCAHEVSNLGSVLRDHSTYQGNVEQFCAPLARIAIRAIGSDVLFGPRDEEILARAAEARGGRVAALAWARWQAAAAVPALAIVLLLTKTSGWLGRQLAGLLGVFHGGAASWLRDRVDRGIVEFGVALLGAAVALAVWGAVAKLAWLPWDSWCRRSEVQGRFGCPRRRRVGFWIAASVPLLLAASVALIVIISLIPESASRASQPRSPSMVENFVAGLVFCFLVGMVVASVSFLGLSDVEGARSDQRRSRHAGRRVKHDRNDHQYALHYRQAEYEHASDLNASACDALLARLQSLTTDAVIETPEIFPSAESFRLAIAPGRFETRRSELRTCAGYAFLVADALNAVYAQASYTGMDTTLEGALKLRIWNRARFDDDFANMLRSACAVARRDGPDLWGSDGTFFAILQCTRLRRALRRTRVGGRRLVTQIAHEEHHLARR